MAACTWEVFGSTNHVTKRESRHLWRSGTQPLAWLVPTGWQAPVRQGSGQGPPWQRRPLPLALEAVTATLHD